MSETEDAYERGYSDGVSSAYNDWEYALRTVAGVPEEVMQRDVTGIGEWLDAELQRNR